MRKFCHVICLGLNLAWGTSVAAAPAAPAPYKSSERTAVAQTRLAAGQPFDPACQNVFHEPERPHFFPALSPFGPQGSVFPQRPSSGLRPPSPAPAGEGHAPAKRGEGETVSASSQYGHAELTWVEVFNVRHFSGKSHAGMAGFNFITGRPTEIDSGLHMIRFVDRYWPAKMGFQPPVRVSTLCFCTPGSTDEGSGEKRCTSAPA